MCPIGHWYCRTRDLNLSSIPNAFLQAPTWRPFLREGTGIWDHVFRPPSCGLFNT
jgi:hypothetical protein